MILWAIERPRILSSKVRRALLDEANELKVSVVSLWEIELKVQAGKLKFPAGPDFLKDNIRKLGIQNFLPLIAAHVQQLSSLPSVHKDPFDRILVSQAIVEGLTLVSKDENKSKYPAKILW